MNASLGIRLELASANEIRGWSNGAVKTHKIMTTDEQRFHPSGLCSEQIFGAATEWMLPSASQSRPMGHIELPQPVFHPLFRRGGAGRAFGCLLGLSIADRDRLLKGETVVVTDAEDLSLAPGSLITRELADSLLNQPGSQLKIESQAEAVRWLLRRANFDEAMHRARALRNQDGGESLRLLKDLQQSNQPPEWLVLDVIPVLPAGLRPIRFSPTGQPQLDDINEFYGGVLRCCSRIRKLEKLKSPIAEIVAAVWILHRRVAALFRHSWGAIRRRGGHGTQRPLARVSDDNSTRLWQDSWIREWPNSARIPLVPNSSLKWFQCGLPRSVETLNLFAPLLLDRFDQTGVHREQARQQLERPNQSTWMLLEQELPRSAVLLTRDMGRSRSSLLAFQPTLTAGLAIQVSPIAAQALSASSNSDEVTVLVLSSRFACSEALVGMLVDQCRNPANGQLVYKPTPDMILGCYCLTRSPSLGTEHAKSEPRAVGSAFGSVADVVNALERGMIDVQTRILLRLDSRQRLETTAGRVLVNTVFPDSFPFLDDEFNAARLSERIHAVDRQFGPIRAMRVLDELQTLALAALTRSGLSFALADLAAPPRKREIIDETRNRITKTTKLFERGLITESERYAHSVDAWTVAEEQITMAVRNCLPSVFTSGAVDFESAKRICGLLGFTRDDQDNLRETPIVSSLAEGVGSGDYWLTTQSARQSQMTELKRRWHANRLSRSLLLAMREIGVTQIDCGTAEGIQKSLPADRPTEQTLSDLIFGRTICETVLNPITSELIATAGELITAPVAAQMDRLGMATLRVRSPITCAAPRGVCQRCYGLDRSTGELPELGTAVGQLAAFSIGEHADKLRERTFRFGPMVRRSVSVSAELPVHPWPADLRPLGLETMTALLAAGPTEQTGVLAAENVIVESVQFGVHDCILRLRNEHGIESLIAVPRSQALAAAEGDFVRAGERLTETHRINPHDILRILGGEAAAQYLLDEMQRCFQHQQIDVDDKHFELVIQRMLSLVEVTSPGDTDFAVGEIVDRSVLHRENERTTALVKVVEPNDSNFTVGQLVSREVWQQRADELVAQCKLPPTAQPPRPATVSLRLSSINHSLPPNGWSRLLPGFTFRDGPALASVALSGATNPVDCVADRAILGCE